MDSSVVLFRVFLEVKIQLNPKLAQTSAFQQYECQKRPIHGWTFLATGRIPRPATVSLIPWPGIRYDVGTTKREKLSENPLKTHLFDPGPLVLTRTSVHLMRLHRLDSALRKRAIHLLESAPG